jgi:hypothetical protein
MIGKKPARGFDPRSASRFPAIMRTKVATLYSRAVASSIAWALAGAELTKRSGKAELAKKAGKEGLANRRRRAICGRTPSEGHKANMQRR